MLPALILLASPSLVVEIDAPKEVRVGEPFHVVARLVNRSKASITVVRPELTTRPLGSRCDGGLFRDDRPVPTEVGGMRMGQVQMAWTFGPWAFRTLKPGESLKIEDVVYRKHYPRGKRPHLKSELASTPKADLPEGQYTLRFSYAFQPELHKNRNPLGQGGPTLALTPEGRTLYQKAWTGEVASTASVTVSGA